jgi:colanic acid/amylovoran biosynthesis glycosyltransferase
MSRLAYLFPAFPVFHQTFVLWEVMGLRRNGIRPRIYSLWRPAERQQPEAESIIGEVTYLTGPASRAVWRANWRFVRSQPRRYLWLYGEIVRAWTTATERPAVNAQWNQRSVFAYDRWRGWFNGHPVLYLLKSLLLVPVGVYFAERLQEEGITHLHVHWASYPATVGYVVHLVSGLPFSISAHAYDIYMVPRMLRAKLEAARFLVTCARANARYLQGLVGTAQQEKIFVIYHGVDVKRFAPRASRAESGGVMAIVSCGQLELYKGMHHLIDACAELARRGVAVRCQIIGDGPQRGPLQRQIERLGLAGRIELLGARAHTEVAALLGEADVFVLASELAGKVGRRDVIANVIVEAMAAGLPVVASRVPGVEELVEDGVTGYLVAPNRSDGLAEAIAALAQHPDDQRRFGWAGRQRVLRDFDSSKNVRLLAQLLLDSSRTETEQPAMTAV